ncbi:hypothetical protein DCAR_0209506 [Daucus carota subsp. sativus]|uniref:ATP-dependent RNA helicase n=1 Tax=Daucus carota subsp. sativus TaxID=79200 RepID=A0AAF0WL91_DAUCS|nr:PREDICTED: probable DEAD-box ATP-dependent RNA helicase 48 isoform X2 [Daucus carota subsp. sativus]WOG90263.1 hypothetical protein DCAR_0209506 [Daucus carota subsp. sativus]
MNIIFLLEHSKPLPRLLQTLTSVRHMGGGPRTFPGGLNKWQWKRLHEKKAREKESKLLDQEKQIYQARIRSDIRAKIDDSSRPIESNYSPISPKDHVKALADRFMKEGAEDLWNADDGPVKVPTYKPNEGPGAQNEGLTNGRNLARNYGVGGFGGLGGVSKPRFYSVGASVRKRPGRYRFRGDDSSSSDADDGSEIEADGNAGRNVKWPRFGVNGIVEDGEGEEEGSGSKKMMVSSAALGNYDRKTTKRIPLKFLENEEDLSQHVAMIRKEFIERSSVKVEEKSDEEESIMSEKRFDEFDVSPLTVKALTSAGYIQMTKVQEATITACLEGKDALVKAKSGTGKSAAFLLPAIETVLKASRLKSRLRVPPVYVLILCPTRELASQLSAEANVLLKYHEGIGVQTLVGGTRFKVDQKRLESDPCQIIVATPGRLLDHIENKSGLSTRLMGLHLLVVDEADHLLDLGFRKDMEKIVDCLPRQRQSLLFSATIPKEVRRVSQLVLQREHAYIDTVGLGLETHAKVNQSYLVVPHEQHFQMVLHLLKEHISQVVDYKVVVFCTTAMMASLMFALLRELRLNVREMHSRKPQLYRTHISDEFKESKRLILVTSNVSARGMNYPDVTLVIQVGIPSDRANYIHRVGRTGREGKAGEGILLVAPWEVHFLDEIKDLSLAKISLPHLDPDMKSKVEDSMAKVDASIKEAAYHAWLGYYNSNTEIGRDKTTLAEHATKFCSSMGLERPPALFRKTALKMGLRGIDGIRIRK